MWSENIAWRITWFYGEPAWEDHHISWDCLRGSSTRPRMPWIVIGEFDEIMFNLEKGDEILGSVLLEIV